MGDATSSPNACVAKPTVSVLADGGEWIWNLAADVVPQATGVLDVFHAVEDPGRSREGRLRPGHRGDDTPHAGRSTGIVGRRQTGWRT